MKKSYVKIFALVLVVFMLFCLVSCEEGYFDFLFEETTKQEEITEPEWQFQVASKDSIKILAIGNSFSDDSMEHMYGILNDCGAKNITLGRLYIGGCSLDKHVANATDNVKAYTFYTNTTGWWNQSATKVSIEDALDFTEWDYISVQQVSGSSGDATTYESLDTLLDYIAEKTESYENKPTMLWNMTWAYSQSSTHSDFGKYDKDQMTMYNAIVGATNSKILTNKKVNIVIPTGTTIQNIRTSYVGDNLNRDGYHLNLGYGRYAAAMTWVKAITGWSIDNVTWTPSNYTINDQMLATIKEAVNAAVANPYEVTKSSQTTEELNNAQKIEAILKDHSVDLNLYTKVDLGLINAGFYQSTHSSKYNRIICASNGDTESNLNQFVSTKIFTKDMLPNGSIIVLLDGYQYRPEGWTNMAKNASADRPGNKTDTFVTVDNTWWGSFTHRAFNIAKAGNPAMNAEEMALCAESFAIYVPKSAPSTSTMSALELFANEYGADALKNYEVLPLTWTYNAFYNSTGATYNKTTTGSGTLLNKFAASNVISASDIPTGSIIVAAQGYDYRPEGWNSAKNTSRPDNYTADFLVVNDAWKALYANRAFNLFKTAGTLSAADFDDIKAGKAIVILIPKEKEKTPEEMTADELFAYLGLKSENYTKLTFDYNNSAYYNSTSSSTVVSKATGSTASNLSQFVATQIFDKSQIPNGSIIICQDGYQYRPEAWTSLTAKTTSRPGNITTRAVVVDDAWWGNFNYRAFNLALKGNPAMTADQMATIPDAIAVYVPVSASVPTPSFKSESDMTIDELLVKNGIDKSKYTALKFDTYQNAYYNSTVSDGSILISAENGSTATNLTQFIATSIITKPELPDGTIIVVKGGYQVRCEGWIELSYINPSAARPSNVTGVTVVNEDWWGSFTYRAFNISKTDGSKLSDADYRNLSDIFMVLVPSDK